MKISLIIPTRERADLLESCLACARAVPDDALEIVVSNNASADHTAQVAACGDPRIAYTCTAERLSMRANFEHALGAATGDYVIFIGDDDGVLPGGMAMLRRFLEAERPEAVGWPLLSYAWPFPEPGQERGTVQIKFSALYGGVRRQDPARLMDQALTARLRSYKEAANIYHGCVSMALIDRVRQAQGGIYFNGASPDVQSSFKNLTLMQGPMVWIDHPVSFGGTSNRSNGANTATRGAQSEAGKAETQRYRNEAASEPETYGLDLRVASVDAVTLDMLRLVAEGTELAQRLDWPAWCGRILRKLARGTHLRAEESAGLFAEYCASHGQETAFAEAAARHSLPPALAQRSAPAQAARRPSRLRLDRVWLAERQGMQTIAETAALLDRLIGPHRPSRTAPLTRALPWARFLSRTRNTIQPTR
ncbi:MAG: glycosyltransferase family 2 protein [Pseudomonadota bacterium]